MNWGSWFTKLVLGRQVSPFRLQATYVWFKRKKNSQRNRPRQSLNLWISLHRSRIVLVWWILIRNIIKAQLFNVYLSVLCPPHCAYHCTEDELIVALEMTVEHKLHSSLHSNRKKRKTLYYFFVPRILHRLAIVCMMKSWKKFKLLSSAPTSKSPSFPPSSCRRMGGIGLPLLIFI